jgi:hypothetical protein
MVAFYMAAFIMAVLAQRLKWVPAGGRAGSARALGRACLGRSGRARFVLKAPFFQLPRESATEEA